MIPFEELVSALERYKARKQAAAAAAPPAKVPSGKPAPAQRAAVQNDDSGAELIDAG